MSKDIEIQQGKNLFEACKAQEVKHYVFSALPYAEKLTDGVLKHVDHFDSKAIVAEHIEANKGDMIASYFMPAMFIDLLARQVEVTNGTASLSMPFPYETTWPLIQPRRDGGKYVMGLFEGGSKANGVKVHAVSTWTTPKEVVDVLSRESGRDFAWNTTLPTVYSSTLKEKTGPVVAEELTQTFQLAGAYNYYGKGEEENQGKHYEWLLEGADLISYPQWAKENGPFKYE
ncbi:hypothetical protein LTR37_001757 [Vermiconidia calcicola]|uniref:Uncharacterized protein n=1 Tax=Vermiconidia calcicola TaxID=1690605 RepID=A0ACC3NV22_9PEZI|nr:hypothetical protein LTR37_001757 [Vermiconidia calcicola]